MKKVYLCIACNFSSDDVNNYVHHLDNGEHIKKDNIYCAKYWNDKINIEVTSDQNLEDKLKQSMECYDFEHNLERIEVEKYIRNQLLFELINKKIKKHEKIKLNNFLSNPLTNPDPSSNPLNSFLIKKHNPLHLVNIRDRTVDEPHGLYKNGKVKFKSQEEHYKEFPIYENSSDEIYKDLGDHSISIKELCNK